MKLSDQLRAALDNCPKSLREIEAETGIDRGLLSRLKSGERGISAALMQSLADYFGMRLTKPIRNQSR